MANQQTQTVIVYRNRWEQQQDEFWFKFMDQHPEVGMAFMGVILALVVGFFVKVAWDVFKSDRYRRF